MIVMSMMDDDDDYLADYDKLKNLKTSPREKFQCKLPNEFLLVWSREVPPILFHAIR